MSLLFLDTETCGLPEWKLPSDHPTQPHLVQLAMLLTDDDLTEKASVNLIIRPDGYEIPHEVAQLHGITTEMATELGVEEKLATRLYASMLYGTGATLICHNTRFDSRVMRIAMLRAGFTKEWLEKRPVKEFCTLEAATPIVNLPPTPKMVAAGFNKPKSASLSECIQFFFNEKLEGAHDALVDVRVYQHLQKQPTQVAETIADISGII